MTDKVTSFVERSIAPEGKLIYLPNDPTTPEFLTETTVPKLPNVCPQFNVLGWTGQSGIFGTPQFQAALVYCTVSTTLKIVQALLSKPISTWSSTKNLFVHPRAGNQLNAYYDRTSLRFFYDMDPKKKKVVFSCESSDVVSHELGHGILDALRPDLWNTASMEIFAFHESFGDILAICHSLEWPGIVDAVIRETNGDIAKSNLVSRVAEELGTAIYNKTGGKAGHEGFLRNAVNKFVYVDPDTLPTSGAQLIREPHSFSQVFTGAWYDSFIEVYKLVAAGQPRQEDAIKKARDVMLGILLGGIANATETHSFYRSMLISMLKTAETVENGQYKKAITSAFGKKGILIADKKKMDLLDTAYIDNNTDGHKATVKLDIPIMGNSKLVVSLPKFHHGYGMADSTSNDRVISRAITAINYANAKNLVGKKSDRKMFFVDQGRFMRNYICNAFCKDCV